MDDVFRFGTYIDTLVSDVVMEDPEYIQHLVDDLGFSFTDDVLNLI